MTWDGVNCINRCCPLWYDCRRSKAVIADGESWMMFGGKNCVYFIRDTRLDGCEGGECRLDAGAVAD